MSHKGKHNIIQGAQKRKEVPNPSADEITNTTTTTTSTDSTPIDSGIKMSKKMKLLMQSTGGIDKMNKGNEVVQLPPPKQQQSPASITQKNSSQQPIIQQSTLVSNTTPTNTNKNNKNKQQQAQLSQLEQLRQLTQQANTPTEPKVSKVKVLAPKAAVQKQVSDVAIPTKINIITNNNPTNNTNTQNKNDKKNNPQNHQQKAPQASTTLQDNLEKKLQGAQFRVLNQQLYTTNSDSAVELMKEQPELFEIYHQGFRTQVEKWPMNPLTVIIDKIKRYISAIQKADKAAGNSEKTILSIADFGCGDAEMALTLAQKAQIVPFNTNTKNFIVDTNNNNPKKGLVNTVRALGNNCQIYSFDLVAPESRSLPIEPTTTTTSTNANPSQKNQPPKKAQQTTSAITACDSRNVPIPSSSVDLAVFCLSLMGTNFKDFLVEAHRVLSVQPNRSRPSLIIAEVRSRFDEQQREGSGKGSDVYTTFIKFVEKLGFSCLGMDKSNKMFVVFEFIKVRKSNTNHGERYDDFTLKPCIYKRR